MFPEPGSVVADKYEILSVVGQGGMGVVYKAHQRSFDRTVALKFLWANDGSEWVERFRREAKILSALKHRNLVSCYELGVWDNNLFVSMEYAEARNLQDALENGGIGVSRTLAIAKQIAEALACAHAAGIVHRDLKPSNILLIGSENEQETVKLIDFGLAKVLKASDTPTSTLTETGFAVGTVQYMSPEQCIGSNVDGRSDLYSLGAVMYACLTGKPPFDNDVQLMVMHDHLNTIPADLTADSVGEPLPSGLDCIVARCLAKQASERYQTADEVRLALDMVAQNRGGEVTRYIPTASFTGAVPVRKKRARAPFIIVASSLLSVSATIGWFVCKSAPVKESVPDNTATALNCVTGRDVLLDFVRTKKALRESGVKLGAITNFPDLALEKLGDLDRGLYCFEAGDKKAAHKFFELAGQLKVRALVTKAVDLAGYENAPESGMLLDFLSAFSDRTHGEMLELVQFMQPCFDGRDRQLLDFVQADMCLENGAFGQASQLLSKLPPVDVVQLERGDLECLSGHPEKAVEPYGKALAEALDLHVATAARLGLARVSAETGQWSKFSLPDAPSNPHDVMSHRALGYRWRMKKSGETGADMNTFWRTEIQSLSQMPRIVQFDMYALKRDHDATHGFALTPEHPFVSSQPLARTQFKWILFWQAINH